MKAKRIMPRLLGLAVLFAPWVVSACPRCVDATPYKSGMLIAVLVLLPVPFVLGFSIFRWIQKAEKNPQ